LHYADAGNRAIGSDAAAVEAQGGNPTRVIACLGGAAGVCIGYTPYVGDYLTFEEGGKYFVSYDKSKGEGGSYTWRPETLELLFLDGPFDVWDARLSSDNGTIYMQYL
jgi:hypothetical protein